MIREINSDSLIIYVKSSKESRGKSVRINRGERSLQRARGCSSAWCALLALPLPPPGPSSQQQTPIPTALAEHPLDQGGCRPPSQTPAEWRQGMSGTWSDGPLLVTALLTWHSGVPASGPLATLQWPCVGG